MEIVFEAESRADVSWWIRTSRGLVMSPLVWQILITASFLSAWEWVPAIPGIRKHIVFADPFFISSPERVARELWRLFTGTHFTPMVWAPLMRTLGTAMAGTVAALIVGSVMGLVCSNWRLINRISRPFLTTFNALPRIALIPIIVLIAGSSVTTDSITAFIVVFFLIFFNAYEGGLSVPLEVLDNARILGAGTLSQLFRIRWPFVIAWTFAQLPNAIAFGIVGTVTAELLTGSSGIGRLLLVAVDTANADLTFAVVFTLGVVGLILVLGSEQVKKRVLHWWSV